MKRAGSNILVVIWVLIVFITVLTVAGYVSGLTESRAYQATADASAFLLQARNIRREMLNMESATLKYAISGMPTFLDSYNKAAVELPGMWSTLEGTIAEVEHEAETPPNLRQRISKMHLDASNWQQQVAQPVIDLRRTQGREAALAAVTDGEHSGIFASFLGSSDAVESYLQIELVEVGEQAANTSNLRQGLLLGMGIVALAIGVLSTWIVRRDLRLQDQAVRAAETEARRLQTIIENVPVGIRLLSSPDGNVILQNRAAEEIFPRDTWNTLRPRERVEYYNFSRSDGTPIIYEELPRVRTEQEGVGIKDFEMVVTRPGPGGRHTNLLMSTAPLLDDHGKIAAVVAVLQDVTRMKELDQRKDEFIATAAHELRSPLTTIVGYNQLMQKLLASVEDLPPNVKTYQAAMVRQTKRLNDLVERLLDASRIQLGRVVLDRSRVNIVELARMVAANTETAEEQRHTIKVTSTQEEIYGNWDMTRLEQVLTNLLSNALRYSPEGEDVDVRFGRTDGLVRVEVVDRGPGVPEENREALFDRYYQGTDTASPITEKLSTPLPKRGSLGLGLYLSSEIIRAHKGQIGVDPNPGGGSIFWFTLPL